MDDAICDVVIWLLSHEQTFPCIPDMWRRIVGLERNGDPIQDGGEGHTGIDSNLHRPVDTEDGEIEEKDRYFGEEEHQTGNNTLGV